MLSAKEIGKYKDYVSGVDNSLSKFFDALSDTNRFKIFTLLLQSKGDICVSEFADILNISVPAASQQLKNLEVSGLIKKVRTGQTTCYVVKQEDPGVKSIVKTIKGFLELLPKKKSALGNFTN